MNKLMLLMGAAMTALASFAETEALVQLISQDGSVTNEFSDLQSAFNASQKGDTVKLLAGTGVTGIAFTGKDVIFDLGGNTLTNVYDEATANFTKFECPAVFDITNSVLTVTNGVIDAVRGTAIRGVGGGNMIKLACDAELLGSFAWTFYPGASTVDIYGKITSTTMEYPCVWLTDPGEVVNVYEGAVLTSKGDVFRHRCYTAEVPANPATLNVYGGEMHGQGYAMIYAYLSDETMVNAGVVNVYGGTWTVDAFNQMQFKSLLMKVSEMKYLPLDGECTARFNNDSGLADLCAQGYVPVKGEDGYFTIRKVPEDDWPEAWPADADDAVKAKFADWSADNPGVDYAQDAVKAAFLMNTSVADDISELKFASIAVADGVATVVVASEGANLGEVNGILCVIGSDDLANWADAVVESEKTVDAGKATFVVEGAKFFKAVLDFKEPVPAN